MRWILRGPPMAKVPDMISRPSPTEWLLALACGGWVAAFDAANGWAFIALGVLITPVMLLLRRRPVVAASATLAALALHWALAGSAESPGILAPALASAFALGRYAAVRWAYAWVGANAALMLALEDGASAVFSAFLLAGPALFGVLVRRRAESARTAEQLHAEAAARDPAAVAAEVVAAERAHLARETVALVRSAVASMHEAATKARDGLGRDDLARIQDLGRSAVTDLRRLLGLLRHEDPPSDASQLPAAHRSAWWLDVATVLGLGLLAALEVATADPPTGPVSVGLAVLATAAVGVRRHDPTTACLAAVVVTAAAIGLREPTTGGFWSAILALLLAWSVGTAGSARAWPALALLATARVALVHLYAPGNEPMEVAFYVVGFVAGYLWAERERAERAALAEVDRLSADTSAVVVAAVREERLRVARELHDVTSHAVGVMVVQAGAAAALVESDPRAASNAVGEVDRAGTQALTELEVLAGILAQPGAPELAVGGDVRDALLALIGRMRAGGLRITHDLADLHGADPAVTSTGYRVVQEALTNALRHAPASAVTVTTGHDDGLLAISVANDAPAIGVVSAPPESGFGLVGLAERVRSLGGSFSAAPSGGGGFVVQARLPLVRADRSAAAR